jgi:hypothetical protein
MRVFRWITRFRCYFAPDQGQYVFSAVCLPRHVSVYRRETKLTAVIFDEFLFRQLYTVFLHFFLTLLTVIMNEIIDHPVSLGDLSINSLHSTN